MIRGRTAAASLAVVTTAAAVLVSALAGSAGAADAGVRAPVVAALQSTVVSSGDRTLFADPVTGLPEAGAPVTVTGAGPAGYYVAICEGVPAENRANCVGAPDTAAPVTSGWVYVTEPTFSAVLAAPAAGGTPNCVPDRCQLYAGVDLSVPLAYAPSSSAPTSPTDPATSPPATPTTESSASVPGTAIAQVIQSPSVVAGAQQLVVFSGFRAGEQVALTLFSAPLDLSPVTADSTGVAQVAFTVPADFAAGTHRLQGIGQESGTVGVASFEVTAPVTSSPSSTPSTVSSPESSAAVSSTSALSPVTTVSTVPTSAVTPGSGASGSSLWWLWLVLAAIVIGAIVAGVLVYRRRKQAEQEEADRQAGLQAAAAEEQRRQQAAIDQANATAQTAFMPRPYPPPGGPGAPGGMPPGYPPGAYPGLLSGRDHPDNPSLYSGGYPPAGPPTGGYPPAGPPQGGYPPAGSPQGPAGPPPPPQQDGPGGGEPPTSVLRDDEPGQDPGDPQRRG